MALWDANTGQLVLDLPHPLGVAAVSFSQDGRRLATAGTDGYARFFVIYTDELIELAQSRVTRSLTNAECQEFLHLDVCPAGN